MLELHWIFYALFILAGAFVGYCFFLECSLLLGLKHRTLASVSERSRNKRVTYKVGKVGTSPRL